jgi:hypothetical protein
MRVVIGCATRLYYDAYFDFRDFPKFIVWEIIIVFFYMGSSSHRAATQAFYGNVLKSSSDEESESETDLLIDAAGMVNKHFLIPPHRGGSSQKM